MYIAETGGSKRGKSGVRYEWNAGDKVDVGKDELEGASGLSWETNDKPDTRSRKSEIKEYLEANDIEYEDEMLKDELLDLV